MSITLLAIIIVVALILLFVVIRIIRSCLPKIIIGLIILGIIAFVAYYYLTR